MIPEKLWAVIAAIVSALGGFVLYERKKVDTRLNKMETDLSDHKADIRELRTHFKELKEDTQEIKEFQKATVDILTAMNIRKRK